MRAARPPMPTEHWKIVALATLLAFLCPASATLLNYTGVCKTGTFAPEAPYMVACHRPDDVSVEGFTTACESAKQPPELHGGESLQGVYVDTIGSENTWHTAVLETNAQYCDLKRLKGNPGAHDYITRFENQCTNLVKGKFVYSACSEMWANEQVKWRQAVTFGQGTLESVCQQYVGSKASYDCCGDDVNDDAFDCSIAADFDASAGAATATTAPTATTATTPTTTPFVAKTTTNASEPTTTLTPTTTESATPTTTVVITTTTPTTVDGNEVPETSASSKSTTPTTTPAAGGGSALMYEAMWAGLCIDATKPDSNYQYSINYKECASLCSEERIKASADPLSPGCTGFAHHNLAEMCLLYPDVKGQFSVFTTNFDCEDDGCGMAYTGWRCYGEPGTAHSGPPGKICPASDFNSRAATASNEIRLTQIWSPASKDCITPPDTGVDCFAEGLSWWSEKGMCVTPCPEGQFANPNNGACIEVAGPIVCGEDTVFDSGTSECTATEVSTLSPEQTTENAVSSNFCGEGTEYNAEENKCVVTAASLSASSASTTVAVGPFTLPLWGLIAIAAVAFLSLVAAIAGCCCCCGCCECTNSSGGDEGYRKYLPDSYTNPAWRQSYASHA